MPNKPTFSAELTPVELEDLRRLSAQLGYTIKGGPRAGDGSLRLLLKHLARAAKTSGIAPTAEALRPILTAELIHSGRDSRK